jgi:hypothetical protein
LDSAPWKEYLQELVLHQEEWRRGGPFRGPEDVYMSLLGRLVKKSGTTTLLPKSPAPSATRMSDYNQLPNTQLALPLGPWILDSTTHQNGYH